MRNVGLLIAILLCNGVAWCGENDGQLAVPVKTGSFTITFTERHPLSGWEAMKGRWNFTPKDLAYHEKGLYKVEEESFQVLVPQAYNGGEQYGLFVWINSGDSGGVPGGWRPIFEKHKLICIGANKSGNSRNVTARFGLSLDAVHNITKTYNIDERRIYISGSSGGGRCASMMTVTHPDVFSGGYYNIGCNYYKDMKTPKGGTWDGFWPNSNPELLEKAKKMRFVFMTGSKDMNQPGTIAAYNASMRDGFRRSIYLEVPNAGHTNPPPDWFEKGIVFLDRYVKWIVPDGKAMLRGVELKHFKGLKKQLIPGKSIRSTISSLKSACKKDDERGIEAKAILHALKAWTVAEMSRLTDMKDKQPSWALESCETFAETVKGLPVCDKVNTIIAELKGDKNVLALVKIRGSIAKYHKKVDEKGVSKSTTKAKEKIQKSIEKFKEAGPSEALIEEAKELAESI